MLVGYSTKEQENVAIKVGACRKHAVTITPSFLFASEAGIDYPPFPPSTPGGMMAHLNHPRLSVQVGRILADLN